MPNQSFPQRLSVPAKIKGTRNDHVELTFPESEQRRDKAVRRGKDRG